MSSIVLIMVLSMTWTSALLLEPYTEGILGEDSCPTGYRNITDPSKCQRASDHLGYEYQRDQNTVHDESVCNWCGGCKTDKGGPSTRVDHTHKQQAKWICELIDSPEELDNLISEFLENPTAMTSEFLENPVAMAAAAAIVGPLALATVVPPPLPMFPPQGLPQPTAGGAPGGGGGSLPITALTNPVVGGEVASLVGGINGGTVLGVFSSNIPGTFAAPRTIPATGILIAEPTIPIISRKFENTSTTNEHRHSCPRPVIDIGHKINIAETKIVPFLSRVLRLIAPITNFQSKISDLQARVFQKLRISCLVPKILRPFEPLFKYVKCKLGLDNDGFMETPQCNATECLNPVIIEKEITRDLGLPNLDFMVEDTVSTMDQCFPEMEKVTYGSRVLAKLVDDQPCDDPRYDSICKEAMDIDRIIFEEDCNSAGCTSPTDDPFIACFGCDNEETKRNLNYQQFHNFIDRQSGEVFQATSQNRRVICGKDPLGNMRCRLRIDRAMQLRRVSYGRALQFIQSEQYLGDDDVSLIR